MVNIRFMPYHQTKLLQIRFRRIAATDNIGQFTILRRDGR